MTCREKFMIENPEAGWFELYTILRCPSDYGYLEDPNFCMGDDSYRCDRCDRCWDREIPEKDGPITESKCQTICDREIPEKDEPIAESKCQTICDRCKSSGVCKYSDDLNIFLHDISDRFPFVTPDFKCEYFNDRKENV